MSSIENRFAQNLEQMSKDEAGAVVWAMLEASGLHPTAAARVSGARGTLYGWRTGKAMTPVRFLLALARAEPSAMDVLIATLGGSREHLEAAKDPELRKLFGALMAAWSNPENRQDIRDGLGPPMKLARIRRGEPTAAEA